MLEASKCSEACCGFGATPAKMQAVVSVLDKNVCSYRRSIVKNIFPRNHKHFVFFAAFVEDCAIIEKDFPYQGNRGMSATKKKREVKICILRWLRCVQGCSRAIINYFLLKSCCCIAIHLFYGDLMQTPNRKASLVSLVMPKHT